MHTNHLTHTLEFEIEQRAMQKLRKYWKRTQQQHIKRTNSTFS